jgi:uncharacterized membrane protein
MVLAVIAASLNAAGDVLQRRSTRRQSHGSASPSWLVRQPAWLSGIAVSLVGLSVHVVALSYGRVALVQPLLTLELPLSVLGGLWVFGGGLQRRDWLAIALLVTGLAGFVFCLDPQAGTPLAVTGRAWSVAGALVVGGGALVAVVGARARRELRAGLLGVAAGAGYGMTAMLFSASGSYFQTGFINLVTAWQPYVALMTAGVSFALLQNALSAGHLVATQPGLTLVNPLVSVSGGLILFHEHARGGPWLMGSVLGAVLLCVGTVLLARSPVLSHHQHRSRDQPTPADRSARPTRVEEPDSGHTAVR